MSYSSLFFDVDNTLLDFNQAEKQAVLRVLSEFSLPSDSNIAALYHSINQSYWERYERGEIPKNAIFAGRFKSLLQALNRTGDPKAISYRYVEHLSDGYFTVEGAVTLLRYLKNKGYQLYATTNGLSSTQYKRLDGSGLRSYFDDIFVSENTVAQKPQKEYFDYVIAHIPEQDRSRILVIGDSQSSDILGAQNAGLDACWYNPDLKTARYPAKYEIQHLTELTGIL